MASGLLKDLVDTAFDILSDVDGDLVTDVTYRQVATGAYDPATDALAVTETDSTLERAVLARFSREEMRPGVHEEGDQKLIFASENLQGVTPQVNDRVVIDSVIWNVEDVMGVPGESVWILHIREA